MVFQPKQKILFVGDSITDCGRRAAAAPYGDGYMNLVRSLLTARYPQLGLHFVNRGVSGDTTRDLQSRWERDVLAEQPDWVSVMIGINDVWRSYGGNSHQGVPLPEYEQSLRDLLTSVRRQGTGLIVMTPYMIEPDLRVPMRQQMDRYSSAAERIAHEQDALLVHSQQAFDDALRHTLPDDWAPDQIHPNNAGHAVLALAWLRAVGFEL